MTTQILVTGGSGFVGSHLIVQLLQAGHEVRATIRNLAREGDVRAMVAAGGANPGERLTFVTADLDRDEGWAEAVAGCDFVHHVASPFPPEAPKHEDELIRPAVEGTLRVLRAARDAGVKRVVLTSSFAAVSYGHKPRRTPFTENDWTNIEGSDVQPYIKSKTLAERAAWDFMAREGGAMELSVINPLGIFGPVLGPDYSTSVTLLKRLLDGAMPGTPRLYFGIVDVRDVAGLHVLAMDSPAAAGERFLCVTAQSLSIHEIAMILREHMGPAAARVPTRQLPDWLVRLVAFRDPGVRNFLPSLGKKREASNEKAKRLLGWNPRSNEEALVSCAESLIRFGLVKTP